MASTQCYRISNSESYETKHYENSSFTQKVTDMVGKVFNGGNNHNHNNQSLCHGQATQQAHHHNNHNNNQSLCYGKATQQAHHNNNHHQQGPYGAGGGLTQTNCTGAYGNHQGHNNNNHNHNHKLGQCGAGCNHGYNHGHNKNNNACSSGQYGNGDYEVRTMKTVVKNRSHSRRNKGCDDGSDSSGSDSD